MLLKSRSRRKTPLWSWWSHKLHKCHGDGVPTSQAAVLWKGLPGLQWKSCPEASWTSEVKVFTLSLSPRHNHKAAGVACKPPSRQPGPEIWWMVLVDATALPLPHFLPVRNHKHACEKPSPSRKKPGSLSWNVQIEQKSYSLDFLKKRAVCVSLPLLLPLLPRTSGVSVMSTKEA